MMRQHLYRLILSAETNQSVHENNELSLDKQQQRKHPVYKFFTLPSFPHYQRPYP